MAFSPFTGMIIHVISDWKWALMKRIVIAHIEVASNSFKTETVWHLIMLVGVPYGFCAVATLYVCTRVD